MTDETAIKQYCNYMGGVKQRISAIQTMGSRPIIDMIHGEIQIESIYLQFRKILELLAMGSLLNNKDEYSKVRADFDKDWNARRIVNDLAKLNPHFYPKPVIDVKGTLRPREGALTQDDFVELYDRCGDVLHTANPFGATVDYKKLSAQVDGWLSKIWVLLNMHQLHMLGDDGFWLIQMTTTDSNLVHYYRFDLVGKKSEGVDE
jgi:hypothetical protein